MKATGNLFAVGPGGVYIRTPQGELPGFVETGVVTSDVALDADGAVLFITAGSAVYRLPLVAGRVSARDP